MKLRIGSAARNALTLVALRYKIKREHVIEIAPLLFFIAAEQSLRVRQEKITGMVASARALLALYDGIPHLPSYWPVDEGVVSSEEESIKARDLFGKKVLEGAPHLMSERHKDYDEAERESVRCIFAGWCRQSRSITRGPGFDTMGTLFRAELRDLR